MKSYRKEIEDSKNLRFYKYVDFRDKVFIIFANPLAYFFYRLGIDANTISLLSGLIAIIGGILLSSSNNYLIFIGSLCFPVFYLLDYVDGIVARLNKKVSVGGQYLDLIIHQVVCLSLSFGLFVGSLKADGNLIIPFGILSIIGSSFFLSRYSIGWFAIIMKYFETKNKNDSESLGLNKEKYRKIIKKPFLISFLSRLGALLFHEDYAIFSLPLIFFFNIFFNNILIFDMRTMITIYGGIILFPAMIMDIIYYTNNRIDINFYNLKDDSFKPNLPDVFYFKN